MTKANHGAPQLLPDFSPEAFAADSENADHLRQTSSLVVHRCRSRRRLLDQSHILLRDVIHLADCLIDLLDVAALLPAGRRDLTARIFKVNYPVRLNRTFVQTSGIQYRCRSVCRDRTGNAKGS